ncbi:DUF4238 domain-containing protein [Labrys neptuniae]
MINSPGKHHYIPAFYLKQWEGPDGKLCEISRVAPGKFDTRRKGRKATGFQYDLYKVEGLPEGVAQDVERLFMAMVDQRADRVLQMFLAGNLSKAEMHWRSAWTRFLLSLLYRNPEAVATLRSAMGKIWASGIERLTTNYSTFRKPTDPDTAEEYMALMDPSAPHRLPLAFLQDIIDNKETGSTIHDMEWNGIDLSGSEIPLLVSDRPLLMPLGLQDPETYIALPISPYRLFVAGHDKRWADRFTATKPTVVVKQINRQVVQQARKLVWSSDDRQLGFIQKHMSELPDRTILSGEQVEHAIQATSCPPQGKCC